MNQEQQIESIVCGGISRFSDVREKKHLKLQIVNNNLNGLNQLKK